MRKRYRQGSAPRVHIHADGKATLSGLHYADLRAILTAASLHHYDTEKDHRAKEAEVEAEATCVGSGLGYVIRQNHRESGAWIKRIRNLLTLADKSMDAAIRPDILNPPPRRATELMPWEVKARLEQVRSDKRFRQSIEEMIAGMRAERIAAAQGVQHVSTEGDTK